jgi:hypothetical protein
MSTTRNWRAFLKDVLKGRDLISHREVSAAKHWESCAIGERTKKLELLGIDVSYALGPDDNRLNKLGLNFYEAINENDVETGLKILNQIDRRIKYLKNEQRR